MQARALTIRLVRLAMAASLLAPCLLFAFASWNSYRNLKALTDERLARSLDVQQEEAQKAFELVNLALSTASDLVAGMSEAHIRADESQLYLQFKRLTSQIPALQSIWICGTDGRALVSSWVPPPPDQNFSDWAFFAAHVQNNIGTYYGQVYQSQFNAQPFFTVSRGSNATENSSALSRPPFFQAISSASSRHWPMARASNTGWSATTDCFWRAIPPFRRARPTA